MPNEVKLCILYLTCTVSCEWQLCWMLAWAKERYLEFGTGLHLVSARLFQETTFLYLVVINTSTTCPCRDNWENYFKCCRSHAKISCLHHYEKKVIFYWRKSYCYLKVCDSRWKVEKSLLRGVKKPSSVRNRWISAALSPSSCLSGAADVKFCTKFPFLVWTKDIEIYRDDLYTGTLLRIHFWGLRRNWRLFHLFNKA